MSPRFSPEYMRQPASTKIWPNAAVGSLRCEPRRGTSMGTAESCISRVRPRWHGGYDWPTLTQEGDAMTFTRISADCHIDMPWMPPDLFTSNASAALRDRMPY